MKDYYIQSSYNSCVGNDIKNDYVDIRPLKNVIKRGARLLDFEIWNIDNEPVVAAGLNSDTKYHFKGTYNHLSISNVFDTINRNAFDGGICPNLNDPLFLLFRIKSKNSNIYVNLANKLSEIFKDRLLSPKYGYSGKYADSNYTLKNTPLKKLMGKVIIICQDLNKNNLIDSDFMEYVNLSNVSGKGFINISRFLDIEQPKEGRTELIKNNKSNLCICLPDTTTNEITILNQGYNTCLNRGVQFICMHYGAGNNKSMGELKKSLNYHSKNLYAYVLKPKLLRTLEEVDLKLPKKQSKKVSMEERKIQLPMYKASI